MPHCPHQSSVDAKRRHDNAHDFKENLIRLPVTRPQRNDEATIEYSNGLLTFENWNQTTTLLVTYEKQYLNSRLNAVLSDIDWKNALQTPLEDK